MKRGPKTGKANRTATPSATPSGLGDVPAELTGMGKEFWLDAVAHMEATGRAHRVYRTPLRIAARLVDSLEADAGLNRIDACRRWLHEMGLTATTGKVSADGTPHTPAQEDGRSKLLRLIEGKAKSA